MHLHLHPNTKSPRSRQGVFLRAARVYWTLEDVRRMHAAERVCGACILSGAAVGGQWNILKRLHFFGRDIPELIWFWERLVGWLQLLAGSQWEVWLEVGPVAKLTRETR